MLISIFIGAVAAVQFAYQLNGTLVPNYYVGYVVRDLTIIELAPTITCLVLAGKVGSNIAVEDNIRFPLDMFTNKTRKERDKRVNYCLERVNLTGNNKKFPSEISGGMQKRVGIARSIVLSPKYLFCDEPNSGLDPKTSILIDELIQSITDEHKMTTIINTHDMNSVMEIGDKINLLHLGKLSWSGTKSEVLTSDNETLKNFIFASPFLQKLRQTAIDS
ncbi:UNVERIFIED_CONTAM: hypothetical protein GTU68_043611 [Idotea baltica]|nr:hypothetical protein [Idotea baltica]